MPTQQTQRDLDHKIIFSSRRNHFFFLSYAVLHIPLEVHLVSADMFARLFLQNEQKSCSYFQYKFIFSPFLPKPLYGSMILTLYSYVRSSSKFKQILSFLMFISLPRLNVFTQESFFLSTFY